MLKCLLFRRPRRQDLLAYSVSIVSIVLISVSASATELESRIARGGRLYDNWITVLKSDAPKDNHPAWPAANTNKTGAVTWRCKSCHGWDYKGRDGAYATGSYKTGIAGITNFSNAELGRVVAIMGDKTHGLGEKLKEQDLQDLALFVSKGQIDLDGMIERANKKPKGDVAKGEIYYNTICAGCHAKDGTMPTDMPESLGKLANDNPWEATHKIFNGQPAEAMPAMRALDGHITADLLAYVATLQKTK